MVTGLYAGILGIIYLGLSFMVVRKRLKHRIGVGDNNNHEILRAVRIHANFAEYVPLALIMMMIIEINNVNPFDVSPLFLHMFGVVLVLARLAHAYGLSQSAGTSPGRFMGTILTFLTLLGLSILLITQYVTT